MSNRYLNSPTLHLRIVESALGRCVLWAYTAMCLLALLLTIQAGYPLVALLLLLPMLAALLPLWGAGSRRYVGSQLCWRAGRWTLDSGAGPQAMELLPRSCVQPWVIYLSWREPGVPGSNCLWIFADSVSRAEWRGLRIRLTLQR